MPPADYAMDMWSVGCVLYELFTGKILFAGRSNNEMLRLMMELKGPFPKKMLKRSAFVDKHFDADNNMSFAMVEVDPVTQKPVWRGRCGRGSIGVCLFVWFAVVEVGTVAEAGVRVGSWYPSQPSLGPRP